MGAKEPKYLVWVRKRECVMRGHGECLGVVQAHHPTGGKGLGQKNDDSRAFPLCTGHHNDRHAFAGVFKKWDKAQMRAWEAAASAECRGVYLGLGEQDSLEP